MATQKITIDPITRIEGHLKIEVEVNDGVVTDAWSSGTLFRGVEKILQGREPEDAWLFTQRLCGVCTYVHGVSSVRSVEDAVNAQIPENARAVRNLLMGGQFVHDHPVHFYHLHALDWVDITSALNADVAATEALAASLSPNASAMDFQGTKERLAGFVASGQLGPFAGGYWGHSAMTLTPEENLLFTTHYLYALRQQVDAAKMHAIFGAKNPHIQSLRVGGVTCSDDISSARIAEFRGYLDAMRSFIDNVYIPDVVHLARQYPEWANLGGFKNYMAYGEFQMADGSLYLPGGVIMNGDIGNIQPVDLAQISEHVQHSWYKGAALHPANGETEPNFTGYDSADRYSWMKAPRYNGQPMEVGPLARVLVAYGKGQPDMVSLVDQLLDMTGLSVSQLHSTLGRTAARALETKAIADAMDGWLAELEVGGAVRVVKSIPQTASGVGLNEAPRGALGHWINIEGQKIGNYQMVVPSTWNCGPRCASNHRGPLEEALVGTPVADAENPVEVLRVVHSYDPCIACAVHMIDTQQDKTYVVKAV